MQAVERTRSFPRTYGTRHPVVHVSLAFGMPHPCGGGALAVRPDVAKAAGVGGEPFCGMDPSNPQTWVRPWNPQPGMIGYLNFDGGKAQGNTPTGGTWRNPQRDRTLRRGRRR